MENLKEIALKNGVSETTVATLLAGLIASNGTQVQFNIAELGGYGQWQPGMIMVGDMFNQMLKHKVNSICTELAPMATQMAKEQVTISQTTVTTVQNTATVAFQGSQNGMSYKYDSAQNMLEITINGQTERFDTSGLLLVGVQQAQQNNTQSLAFQTKDGVVCLEQLKKI